jgi:hypothetical protein
VILFDYVAPSMADVPDATVFTLATNIIFTNTAKVETITFDIKLDYCASVWPTRPV